MRLARELRLIPVVAIAAAALFVLKTSAIVIEGGYTLIASRSAQAQGLGVRAPEAPDDTAPRPERPRENGVKPAANSPVNSSVNSWVRDLYSPPAQTEDITGTVAAPPKPEPPKDANAAAPTADKNAPAPAPLDTARPMMSAGERAVL